MVVIMGLYDFVVGIGVGIILASVSLVVQTSRVPAVRASYSGEVAGSTVRRNPTQLRFLRAVGQQIHVTKLAGYIFFGTIVKVEDQLRALIEDEAFAENPIRFLVLDLWHVSGIDYSAAEAFNRLSRLFHQKGVTLYISGIKAESPIAKGLEKIGLTGKGDIQVTLFEDLNSALESCENELLKTLYASKEARAMDGPTSHLAVPRASSPYSNIDNHSHNHSLDGISHSPRFKHLQRSATMTLDHSPTEARYHNFAEPLRLILQTFQGLTTKNEDFWYKAQPFFEKKLFVQGTVLFNRGESAKGFYLLQEGVLRADYELPQGRYFESIVAGTTCGELPFFSETDRTATVLAETSCTTWLLSRESWERLQEEQPGVARELLRISLKLTSERMSAITSYVLTTAG